MFKHVVHTAPKLGSPSQVLHPCGRTWMRNPIASASRNQAWRYQPRRLISTDSLPTILQPAFWRSLTPKSLRRQSDDTTSVTPARKKKTKDWNPATFFIVIFMLIGSQSIQMISLHRNFDLFSHQTEAKLTLLRDVVHRLRMGEDIDVEAVLGKGDERREREWEDVIRELEEEDTRLASERRLKRARRAAQQAEQAATSAKLDEK